MPLLYIKIFKHFDNEIQCVYDPIELCRLQK
jgi:hypothetical protein